MTREKENARRLVGALERHADAPGLALILGYHPEQLQEDIKSLVQYMRQPVEVSEAEYNDLLSKGLL